MLKSYITDKNNVYSNLLWDEGGGELFVFAGLGGGVIAGEGYITDWESAYNAGGEALCGFFFWGGGR